jgi:hypothetical protein
MRIRCADIRASASAGFRLSAARMRSSMASATVDLACSLDLIPCAAIARSICGASTASNFEEESASFRSRNPVSGESSILAIASSLVMAKTARSHSVDNSAVGTQGSFAMSVGTLASNSVKSRSSLGALPARCPPKSLCFVGGSWRVHRSSQSWVSRFLSEVNNLTLGNGRITPCWARSWPAGRTARALCRTRHDMPGFGLVDTRGSRLSWVVAGCGHRTPQAMKPNHETRNRSA